MKMKMNEYDEDARERELRKHGGVACRSVGERYPIRGIVKCDRERNGVTASLAVVRQTFATMRRAVGAAESTFEVTDVISHWRAVAPGLTSGNENVRTTISNGLLLSMFGWGGQS